MKGGDWWEVVKDDLPLKQALETARFLKGQENTLAWQTLPRQYRLGPVGLNRKYKVKRKGGVFQIVSLIIQDRTRTK